MITTITISVVVECKGLTDLETIVEMYLIEDISRRIQMSYPEE